MPWLLDTSAAILLRDGLSDARNRLLDLEDIPALAAITRVELEGGVYAIPALSQRRRATVDALLAEFEIVDFTDATAQVYGRIVEAAGYSRRKVIDRMIAATALVEGRTLITCDGEDFRDIPDLHLEYWPIP